ncbi:hypothetical protein E4U57_006382 [Claviceps arundinis]|uniref:Uncharacterized protein n=1 Tax=Claviceps arundinis TaxID=1623583 RepID=A0A9P7SSE6_9HYPO|nr:hypothetical protein E4U57_006382 [Claviceps arundinis]KAG5976990.1 hypothetical protein E4U56_000812 [Claviceps arundinis]
MASTPAATGSLLCAQLHKPLMMIITIGSDVNCANDIFKTFASRIISSSPAIPISHLICICFSPFDPAGLAGYSQPQVGQRRRGRMVSPAGNLALLILGIIALCVIIAWFLKLRVYEYVQALSSHRREQARARDAETTDSSEGTSSEEIEVSRPAEVLIKGRVSVF